MPAWVLKPHLSRTGYRKSRAGKVAGSKIGGKKGRSSKKGSTGAFGVVTTSI